MSSDPRDPAPHGAQPATVAAVNGIEAWLLTEAVRLHEEAAGPLPEAATAEAVARAAGGDLAHRIAVRARELDRRLHMSAALSQVRAASGLVVAGVLALAAAAGAGTAQAVTGPGGGNAVNFFVVLFAALGPASVALLLWLVLAMARSTRAAGLFGRAAAALGGRIALLAHRDPARVSAVRAIGGLMLGSPYGRWTLAMVTHATWLAFLAAVLAVVLFLLSTRSYVFVWETTILSADTYVPLTRWLAALPALLGFPAPDPDQIRASQWIGSGDQAAAARDAWAGLLVGCIVLYGIAPRLVLIVLCFVLRARAGRRLRLDTTRPGFARLSPRLMPAAENMGFVDSSSGIEPSRPHRHPAAVTGRIEGDPHGPVAVLGAEIDVPSSGWPPPLGPGATLDLGRAQSRQDIKQALDALRQAAPRPRLLIVVCALTTTPDRGTLAQIDAIMAASAIPLALLLTGGQRLRARASGDGVTLRIADWHALAEQAGIERDRIAEIDLDNITDMSRAKLRALVDGRSEPREKGDRLERAFALIRGESALWTSVPDLEAQAELHREIARLYQGKGGWQKLFDPRGLGETDLASRLRSGSDAVVAMLPRRLALDPRWLTAGAIGGAIGCIAVATLAAPVAIAGLPLWAGFGAALTAAVRSTLRARGVADDSQVDATEAVKAAALFALVLESQGHDEVAITGMIDAAIGDDDAALGSAAEVAAWLDRVRLRYRDAERKEAGSA